MMRKTLTIFEGPDGSGKTTAAKTYAESVCAIYVHFPAYPEITDNELARVYLRAMESLVVEQRDVVFDRSWLSERPYGSVFRNGLYRLGENTQGTLEDIAKVFDTVVILCDPGLEVCLNNYRTRKNLEMLDNEDQLAAVHKAYYEIDTTLPFAVYNYKADGDITLFVNEVVSNAQF